MSIKTITTFIAISMLFTGCGTLPDRSNHAPQIQSAPPSSQLDLTPDKIKQRLYSQHKLWQGTRYKLGGLSKKGVDCSGFVLLTFKEQLGITLPRTTREQAKKGTTISRSQLKAGDLVFFKTSIKVRHVGIYIEDEKFLHASTSKGVMISDLNNSYWRKAYWKAVRP